jgi:hypothetical protein
MIRLRTIDITEWKEYQKLADSIEFRSWAFRGQSDSTWPLFTSLARYLRNCGIHRDAWRPQEERILRIFQRKAHLFLEHIPDLMDSFQWLALMQHHGAPTRLLDFTWSPHVAAFFALECATVDAAVWALNPPKVTETVNSLIPPLDTLKPDEYNFRGSENFEKFFLPGVHPFVFIGEPFVMNKRLIAQEGSFAVPGIIEKPIEDVLSLHPDSDHTIVKIVLHTSNIRREAMRSLYNMNITNATLFPDLEGLARSMALELEYHWAYDPHTMAPTPGFT